MGSLESRLGLESLEDLDCWGYIVTSVFPNTHSGRHSSNPSFLLFGTNCAAWAGSLISEQPRAAKGAQVRTLPNPSTAPTRVLYVHCVVQPPQKDFALARSHASETLRLGRLLSTYNPLASVEPHRGPRVREGEVKEMAW